MKFVFIIFLINFANCEIFSSTDELLSLVKNGRDFAEALKNLIGNLESEVGALKSKLSSLESELSSFESDPQSYVGNPLNAFVLIKTLSIDVESIKSNLHETFETFSNSSDSFKLPHEDFRGAVEGFVRLQKVYELESEDLANGIIDGVKIREKLSSLQIFALANEMTEIDRKIAGEYFEIALERASEHFEMKILEKIVENYRQMGKFSKAVEVIDKNVDDDDKKFTKLRQEFSQLEDIPEEDLSEELSGTHYTKIKADKIFSQACMGKRLKNITETSKLYCTYHSTNAFTKIAPFKFEIVNFEPLVGIFYEIISDREIEILKSLAIPNLERGRVGVGKKNTKISNIRISKSHFIPRKNEHQETVEVIKRRIADMSGLNMETAERLIVQNYGIGGHYGLHHDFDTHNLSDVIKGGGTVFPLLRLYVPARKGTAVFWYNLSTSGHFEFLTRHGGCPVLIGSKWVSNKWIEIKGQEYSRPCELVERPDDRDYDIKYYTLD